MSGNKLFIDTNILVFLLLNKDQEIAYIIDKYEIHISFITKIELLCRPYLTKSEKSNIIELIELNCTVHKVDDLIINETIKIKSEYKLKIPDAIIAATAKILNYSLLTADKEFEKLKNIIDVNIYSKN
jgi:predicted nucleic acid-binding protein